MLHRVRGYSDCCHGGDHAEHPHPGGWRREEGVWRARRGKENGEWRFNQKGGAAADVQGKPWGSVGERRGAPATCNPPLCTPTPASACTPPLRTPPLHPHYTPPLHTPSCFHQQPTPAFASTSVDAATGTPPLHPHPRTLNAPHPCRQPPAPHPCTLPPLLSPAPQYCTHHCTLPLHSNRTHPCFDLHPAPAYPLLTTPITASPPLHPTRTPPSPPTTTGDRQYPRTTPLPLHLHPRNLNAPHHCIPPPHPNRTPLLHTQLLLPPAPHPCAPTPAPTPTP